MELEEAIKRLAFFIRDRAIEHAGVTRIRPSWSEKEREEFSGVSTDKLEELIRSELSRVKLC